MFEIVHIILESILALRGYSHNDFQTCYKWFNIVEFLCLKYFDLFSFKVAMFGGSKGSSIQRDLTRIAKAADTSSREGVSHLLTGSIRKRGIACDNYLIIM